MLAATVQMNIIHAAALHTQETHLLFSITIMEKEILTLNASSCETFTLRNSSKPELIKIMLFKNTIV